jgi:hypothetical protein
VLDYTTLYACFIGDGYADVEPPADTGGPEEGPRYWYTPRHSEVSCPSCDATGRIEYDRRGRDQVRDCTCCDGTGYVEGEPFTVTRYTFATPEAARACYDACEDTGDGYERAGVLARAAAAGECEAVDVVEWEPDHTPDPGGPPDDDTDDGDDDTDDTDDTDDDDTDRTNTLDV